MYETQEWIAPEGTGLNRFLKGTETETHIELTIDPEDMTNSPTPFTVARMNHIEDGIEEAHRIANQIKNKVVVCVGDSYNLDTEWWEGWGAKLGELLAEPDVTVYSYSAPGGGFVAAAETYSFLTALQNHAYGDEVIDKTKVTDIFVLGGYNDMITSATEGAINTAIGIFMAYCETNYPNAKVTISMIGIDFNSPTKQANLATYAEIYDQYGAKWGARTHPNFKYILRNRNRIFISDGNPNSGYHPSTVGNVNIAVKILEFMYEGHFDVEMSNFTLGASVYFKNGQINITDLPYQSPSVPRQSFLDLAVRGKSYPNNTWVEVGSTIIPTGECLLWGALPTSTANFDGFCFYNVGSGTGAVTIASTFQFKIVDKKVYALNAGSADTITISGAYYIGGISNLHFSPFEIY
jgi:hypothetical protein